MWVSAFELDQTSIINPRVCFLKCRKMMKVLRIPEKSQEIDHHHEIICWISSDEDLVREERKMLALLYEFPAETRLTVYRRPYIAAAELGRNMFFFENLDNWTIKKEWPSPSRWGL